MTTPPNDASLSITRSELLALTVANILGGGAASGLIAFALMRFGHLAPPLAYAVAFVVLGLLLYIPIKLRKRSVGVDLGLMRFLLACAAGAVVAGLLLFLFYR